MSEQEKAHVTTMDVNPGESLTVRVRRGGQPGPVQVAIRVPCGGVAEVSRQLEPDPNEKDRHRRRGAEHTEESR